MAKYLKLFKDDSERIPYETSGYTEPYVSVTKESKEYTAVLLGHPVSVTMNSDGTFTADIERFNINVTVSSLNNLLFIANGANIIQELTGVTLVDGEDSEVLISGETYYAKWVPYFGEGWNLYTDQTYSDQALFGSVIRFDITEIDNGSLMHYNKSILATLILDDDSTVEISGWYKSGWPTDDELDDSEKYGFLTKKLISPYCDRVVSVIIEKDFRRGDWGGYYTFSDCWKLRSAIISSGVTNMQGDLFADCTSLETITVDPNNHKFDSRDNCNAVISTLTNELICGCKNTIIPNSVLSICDEAFRFRTNLTSMVIPMYVTKIGRSAFYDCYSLSSITIPESVTYIGSGAFGNCTNLTEISIPSSVKSIEMHMFNGCSNLSSITIPKSIVDVGGSAFDNTPWWNAYSADTNNHYGNIIYINNVAYKAVSTAITECSFKENTVSISQNAFFVCRNLTNVIIPNGIAKIDFSTFSNCSNLSSVTIPSSVKEIKNDAFGSCTKLSSITSLATTAPTIGDYTFNEIKTGGTLYVPQGSTGYDVWMQNADYYLGKYNWTKVEQ